MAWTDAEMRAIAEGEAAADAPGVIPSDLNGAKREAWRQGFARGWNGLGEATAIDLAEHRSQRTAWKAGWQAGMAMCKEAMRGYKRKAHDESLDAVVNVARSDREMWTQPKRDAFTDGIVSGRKGLMPYPTPRYRGRMRDLSPWWNLGWPLGLAMTTMDSKLELWMSKLAEREKKLEAAEEAFRASEERLRLYEADMLEREQAWELQFDRAKEVYATDSRAGARAYSRARHAEARVRAQLAAAEEPPGETAAGPVHSTHEADTAPEAPRRPRSGAERQREYRARRRTVSIDLSEATHTLLRQLYDRETDIIDFVLAALLDAALRDPRIGRVL